MPHTAEDAKRVLEQLTERRILILGEKINEEMVDRLRREILTLTLKSMEKKITLVIDSNGGDCEPALWLYDFIRAVPTPIIGIVHGRCKSSAVSVLQACTQRLSTRHSWFYLHMIQGTFRGGAFEEEVHERFRSHLAVSKTVQEQMWGLLAARTKKSSEEMRHLCEEGEKIRRDFSAEEALELNIIDGIVEEPWLLTNTPLSLKTL